MYISMRFGSKSESHRSCVSTPPRARVSTPPRARVSTPPRARVTTARNRLSSSRATPENRDRDPSAPPTEDAIQEIKKRFQVDDMVKEMGDADKLGSRGEAYFAAQIILILLVVLTPKSIDSFANGLGIVSLLFGLVVIFAAVTDMGASLYPFPEPRATNKLITKGLYAYARHPMYGGVLLGTYGLSAFTHSPGKMLLAILLTILLDRKATKEEEALARRYGTDYEDYKTKVAKFFPFIW